MLGNAQILKGNEVLGGISLFINCLLLRGTFLLFAYKLFKMSFAVK